MTFIRISFTKYVYKLNISINPIAGESVRNVGYIISPRLHIQEIYCKVLGFLQRILREFKLNAPLKYLHCALARSVFEIGSILSIDLLR